MRGEFEQAIMATASKIEWTEKTWNPVTGCVKISAGCKHCYAERMAKHLYAMGVERYRHAFKPTLRHDLIDLPKRWIKPSIIFVNSMSDLFEDTVPEEFIGNVFETICACPQHTFQVLTKRSARLRDMAQRLPWPQNVWMGVSVEDEHVVQRVHDLRHVPARVRFVSCEPLLAPLPNLPLEGIHWVIVGGESGPNARPMQADWVEDIYRQCRAKNVSFFFKQWGGFARIGLGVPCIVGRMTICQSLHPRRATQGRSLALVFMRRLSGAPRQGTRPATTATSSIQQNGSCGG